MKDNFQKWIDFCFFYECGGKDEPNWKHNIPGDPGGLTIYGISHRAHPKDILIMNEMSKPEARVHAARVAKEDYWNRLDCDDLPHGMDIVIADIAYNQGEGRAREILPCAIDWRDAEILRLDKYDDLQKLFTRFGAGWSKRLVSLRDYIVSGFTVLEWDRKELVNGNIYSNSPQSPLNPRGEVQKTPS